MLETHPNIPVADGRRCLLVFEPPDGGVAEHVLRLGAGLPVHGWHPWIAGPLKSITYPALRNAGTPIARLPLVRGFDRPEQDALALRAIGRILRNRRFDLVHAHSAKAGVLARAAARMAGVPVVYSPHCFPFVGPWGWRRRLLSTSIERALGALTDTIICVAEQERELALEHHIADDRRLAVVHNGAPAYPTGLTPDPRLTAFADDRPLVGCLAVLRPQKAVDVFVAAAPRVLAECPSARLAVIGDGDLLPRLQAQAVSLGLREDRFRFFSFEPPAARQLGALDVFVLPSAWEAFPISVLEALACGVPQVATDVGGTSEALEHGMTGLLCSPNDPDDLAAQIVVLLGDPNLRARMAEASVARHRRHFTVGQMVARTAQIYDDVLSRSLQPMGSGLIHDESCHGAIPRHAD